ncbi:hypothetical protein ACB094_07G031700 [Castanea mollissima]
MVLYCTNGYGDDGNLAKKWSTKEHLYPICKLDQSKDAGSCNLYICMSGNVIDWIFAHNACNDSVKEPMQKYITASKVVLQYVDNIFLSAETGAEPLKMI